VLELNENDVIQEFFESMILLYEAVCDQSNNYVAHSICKLIDEKQLFYCIQNPCNLIKKYYKVFIINNILKIFHFI
jgi:hypothetical protein